MRALILSAGIGQRLRPLTEDRPKPLVKVAGRTLLARMIDQLARVGVSQVVVATGFAEASVRAALAESPVPTVTCRNDAYDRTQTVASVAVCADALLAGGADDTLVFDGDLFLEDSFHTRLCGAPFEGAGMIVAVDRRDDLGAEEMKVLCDGDRVIAFGKGLDPKKSAGEATGAVRIAASALPAILAAVGAAVTAGRTNLYYEDVWHECLRANGGTLEARAVDVADLRWTEIDTHEDLARAEELAAGDAPPTT
ncbi:MAG: phosphocholine cytidylyltransferase family protein [Myxococcales bacterium]|nr:phosphocholine cytidylyltransferase family protein [Myxococcales bacterium]